MKMKKKSTANGKRSFFDLTPEERDRDVARFDKPIDIDRDTRPLTVKERALFDRMMGNKPKTGLASKYQRTRLKQSPKNGNAHSPIPKRSTARLFNGLDPQIVSRIEKYADEHEISPQEFVAKSLVSSLTFVGG